MVSPITSSSLRKMKLVHEPVAVAFSAIPPPGVDHIDRAAAAGCAYWKHASEGHAFYTTEDDHQNCPIGAFTHGVTLHPAKAQELESLMGTMIHLEYLRGEEIPQIPHRTEPMQIATYAPLDRATFPPDVVIFRGTLRQIMLLTEAARAAGAFDSGLAIGRPACAAIPQALDSGASVASVGCIGNRVYTGLGDDELYFAVPGRALESTLGKLETILNANTELESFHRQRAATLAG
jgi:uncharacterized protein (DUF169 family)